MMTKILLLFTCLATTVVAIATPSADMVYNDDNNNNNDGHHSIAVRTGCGTVHVAVGNERRVDIEICSIKFK